MSITFPVGDAGHLAILACKNLDGTDATDVAISYTSSDPSIVSVDTTSGALTLVAPGTATITGTGTRGTFMHSDTGDVTVTAAGADFTAALTLA